jgi:hypothetical protein
MGSGWNSCNFAFKRILTQPRGIGLPVSWLPDMMKSSETGGIYIQNRCKELGGVCDISSNNKKGNIII